MSDPCSAPSAAISDSYSKGENKRKRSVSPSSGATDALEAFRGDMLARTAAARGLARSMRERRIRAITDAVKAQTAVRSGQARLDHLQVCFRTFTHAMGLQHTHANPTVAGGGGSLALREADLHSEPGFDQLLLCEGEPFLRHARLSNLRVCADVCAFAAQGELGRLRCILLERVVQLRDIDKLLALARQDHARARAAQDAAIKVARDADEVRPQPSCRHSVGLNPGEGKPFPDPLPRALQH